MHLYWIKFWPLEWLRTVGGCMVVERKVELTRGNGWTRLRNLSTVHSLYQTIRVWKDHATDVEMLFVRTRGCWHNTFTSFFSCQAIRCGRITVSQSIKKLHQWRKRRMTGGVTIGWMSRLMLYDRSLKQTMRILLHRRCKHFSTSLELRKSCCMNTWQ
jgi:hypothetical protein